MISQLHYVSAVVLKIKKKPDAKELSGEFFCSKLFCVFGTEQVIEIGGGIVNI